MIQDTWGIFNILKMADLKHFKYLHLADLELRSGVRLCGIWLAENN